MIKRITKFMGNRKKLYPIALCLSSISAITSVLPIFFIYLIIARLLNNNPNITAYAWWAFGIAILSILLYYASLSLSHLVGFRVENNLRTDSIKRICKMPLGFFDIHPTGKIRKIIDENVTLTHSFVAHQLPDLAGAIVLPIIALGFIIIFDWKLGLACLIPIILASGTMMYMMQNSAKKFMTEYMNSMEEMNTEAVEYIRGIPVVKVFQQTLYSFKNFHKTILKYKDMVMLYTKTWKRPMSIYTLLIHSFAFILVPLAIIIINHSGNYIETITHFMVYILVTPIFCTSIMRLMYLSSDYDKIKQALDRLEDLLNYPQIEESLNPKTPNSYTIKFKNVSFNYPGFKENAVENLNFEIPEGQKYALVGVSGSGKSTIAKLIPRFWDVSHGSIEIGGINIKDIPNEELMSCISFVFQTTSLFKTTLEENIKYGSCGYGKVPKEHIRRALKCAQAEKIIENLPDGLNTKIGADGTYLSGGEQQRIALTRAIIKDAPIVILDEATAFTDPENEKEIHEAFKEIMKGKTVLMLAHRLSSVVDCDKILVLKDGKIIEAGTHSELIAQDGEFKHMWDQFNQSLSWTLTN